MEFSMRTVLYGKEQQTVYYPPSRFEVIEQPEAERLVLKEQAEHFNTLAVETATFDNASVTVGTTHYITAISPTLGPVGTTSTLKTNGATGTSIMSWTNNQIVAVVQPARCQAWDQSQSRSIPSPALPPLISMF
jgi:hypothetical protein